MTPPHLRFALLRHTGWPGRADHYDLLLETVPGTDPDAAVLLAFNTVADPFALPGDGTQFVRGADHRRVYLDYEGVVSAGRGTVARVDGGPLRWIDPPADAAPIFNFLLFGTRLRGAWYLERRNGIYVLRCG